MAVKSNTSPLIFIVISLLLTSFLLTANGTPLEVEDEPLFSYDIGAVNGPKNWANLKVSWAVCGNGSRQSPIDIVQVIYGPSSCRDLDLEYRSAQAIIKNRGHDIEVKWTEDAGGIEISGIEYKLLQCHWHIPPEHAINGTKVDMELHIVHVSSRKDIVVISIMYKLGREPDSFISELAPYLQSVSKTEKPLRRIDPEDIEIPRKSGYYKYIGSLTTPPCSENVTWILLKEVKSVSSQQIKSLTDVVDDGSKGNARPLQPLNGRPVYSFYRD